MTADLGTFAFVTALQKLLNTKHPTVLWFDAPRVSFAISRRGDIVAEVERTFDGQATYNKLKFATIEEAKAAALREIKKKESSDTLTSIEWRKRGKKKAND